MNEGFYVKLEQGLCSFNQVLPREYINTLKVLKNKVSQGYTGDKFLSHIEGLEILA